MGIPPCFSYQVTSEFNLFLFLLAYKESMLLRFSYLCFWSELFFLRLKTLTCKTRGKFLLEIKHDILPFKTKLIPWVLVENIDNVLKVRLASLFRPSWRVSPCSSERHCYYQNNFLCIFTLSCFCVLEEACLLSEKHLKLWLSESYPCCYIVFLE